VNAGGMKLTGVAGPRLGVDLKRHTAADNLYHEHSARGGPYRANPHAFFDLVCGCGLLKPPKARVIVGPSRFHRSLWLT
jgi:hypothetical protein